MPPDSRPIRCSPAVGRGLTGVRKKRRRREGARRLFEIFALARARCSSTALCGGVLEVGSRDVCVCMASYIGRLLLK